ncbi:hypothetical protein CC2G_004163 [Coprinopsis cinerea AmutBmut pab1-1]|nr:hypothetical protein CC2G_004163 [Coprinopsis cinerea AmutBmut pab1-1]
MSLQAPRASDVLCIAALCLLGCLAVQQRRIWKSRQWRVQDKSQGQKPHLAHLPIDLLVEIMTHLDWDDVLVLRKCCRSLHAASKERQVWHSLLVQYCDTVFPRPFFLPKPLEHCSGEDLEHCIVGWLSGWDHFLDPSLELRTMESHACPPGIFGPLEPLPGGRFFIYGGNDDSLFYCDPTQPDPTMHLLVPSPNFENSSTISTALDVLGTQGIDGESTTLQDRLFPRTFRLARILGVTWGKGLIEIWEINARVEGGTHVGYTSKLLKAFSDHIYVGQGNCCSLLGRHVAYVRKGNRHAFDLGVRIVDWTSVSGDEDPTNLPGVAIPGPTPPLMVLLPHRRILMADDRIAIWDWGRSCPSIASLGTSRGAFIKPQWAVSSPRFAPAPPFTPLFYIGEFIRLVLPTRGNTLIGFSISTDPGKEVASSVEMSVLGEDDFRRHDFPMSFHYRLGVRLGRKVDTLMFYRWPDDPPFVPSASLLETNLPSSVRREGTIIHFDILHGQLVFFCDPYLCRLCSSKTET